MKIRLILLLLLQICNYSMAQKVYPTIGETIYLDPSLQAILPKDSKIEVLASGFQWSEGPVWIKKEGYLLFSDVPANTIFQWKESTGLSTFLKPSGYTGIGMYSDEPGSNGLIINQKGELVSCEHGDRRVSSMSLIKGGKRTLADNFEGKRFNSPNDVVQHANGSYYFTDPPYGLEKKQDDPSREIKEFGVYKITPNGKVTMQINNLSRPNGLAFSPDGKTLYVAQSDPERAIWMKYPVDSQGNIGTGTLLLDVTSSLKIDQLKGLPDGLKIDKDGNLWASGPGGIWIISPAGKVLGRLNIGELTSNCAWGDDGSTLYLTVNGYLCRIKTNTKGAGW